MKESRIKFIKRAHESACSEWKTEIESEFPKLFPKSELEVGRWYKRSDVDDCLSVWNKGEDTYGFWRGE